MTRLSILGFGRFGAAFASLAAEAGLAVRAFDPTADIPQTLRADSLDDLLAGADVLAVAVPIAAMRDSFDAVAPLLGKGSIVFDVGSVKTLPARAMAEVFGGRQPWVAAHPLFGPTSLARGERPLRAVVCPNPLHPAAVATVERLFVRMGCQVIRQTPEEHDRAMAFTHALGFFVAKGMIDAGVPVDEPAAPPSFQAIEKLIELVRSDAGHLFLALHRENPFAPEARRSLLASLSAIDRDLDRPASDTAAARALAIPDLGARSPELREAREQIDDLDRELVALLARRAELARRAARAKAGLGAGIQDPEREAKLVEMRRQWAVDSRLDPDSLDDIFQAVLRFSRRLQEK